jgi:hypothetical protein
MSALYTLIVEFDGGQEITQEAAPTAAIAIDQWTRRLIPDGVICSLTEEERTELREDFSASEPTIFGIDKPISALKNVWRVSTSLRSGRHIMLVCVLSDTLSANVPPFKLEIAEAEQAGTCDAEEAV